MNTLIQEMIGILTASFKRGEVVPLHALLWSIDAKNHLIPNVDEINDALENSPNSLIERNEKGVFFAPSNIKSKDRITDNDVEEAMKIYRGLVQSFIEKSKKKKPTN